MMSVYSHEMLSHEHKFKQAHILARTPNSYTTLTAIGCFNIRSTCIKHFKGRRLCWVVTNACVV